MTSYGNHIFSGELAKVTTAQTQTPWELRAHLAATPALKEGGLSWEFL